MTFHARALILLREPFMRPWRGAVSGVNGVPTTFLSFIGFDILRYLIICNQKAEVCPLSEAQPTMYAHTSMLITCNPARKFSVPFSRFMDCWLRRNRLTLAFESRIPPLPLKAHHEEISSR